MSTVTVITIVVSCYVWILEPRQCHRPLRPVSLPSISMSGILDEAHSNNALTTPPRKRSRHDSSCGPESSPGASHGGSGSGSSVNGGSIENDDDGDGRQGGSQKRARSEGLGEPDNSLGSVSWSRGGHPLPLHSVETTRQFSGRTTNESSLVDSLIPLPAVPRREMHRDSDQSNDNRHDGSSSVGLSYTAREDLARSMEFDQQMDVLRRSPPPVSLSPSIASQTASTGDDL